VGMWWMGGDGGGRDPQCPNTINRRNGRKRQDMIIISGTKWPPIPSLMGEMGVKWGCY
jgi:hypothetical protein